MKILITGSGGLVGSESVFHFSKNKNNKIYGIDNNSRKKFFGIQGDVSNQIKELVKIPNYKHYNKDIRNFSFLKRLLKKHKFDAIIHCAAQPSHDYPEVNNKIIEDYDINVTATVNLLDLTRKYCDDAVFIYMSTNKYYGDAPNKIDRVELDYRYDYNDIRFTDGIPEDLNIHGALHSFFGAGKVAADTYVKEYGDNLGMNTVCFRGGCLTGSKHSGTSQHGYLNYIVKCALNGTHYEINGYKGKQVRDNIHSYDLVKAFEEVIENPVQGQVFNMGGGKDNSVSILETIRLIEKNIGKSLNFSYNQRNRKGDHIVYYSDLKKFKSFYKNWSIEYSVEDIINDIALKSRGKK